MDSCDVFVIGGTPARHLASSGKCVLLLERGDWLLGKPPLAPARRRDRGDQVCPSGRCLPVRHGSGHLGVEHRLTGAQVRQPLRRGHERLLAERQELRGV
jgi:hypothetical protein